MTDFSLKCVAAKNVAICESSDERFQCRSADSAEGQPQEMICKDRVRLEFARIAASSNWPMMHWIYGQQQKPAEPNPKSIPILSAGCSEEKEPIMTEVPGSGEPPIPEGCPEKLEVLRNALINIESRSGVDHYSESRNREASMSVDCGDTFTFKLKNGGDPRMQFFAYTDTRNISTDHTKYIPDGAHGTKYELIEDSRIYVRENGEVTVNPNGMHGDVTLVFRLEKIDEEGCLVVSDPFFVNIKVGACEF